MPLISEIVDDEVRGDSYKLRPEPKKPAGFFSRKYAEAKERYHEYKEQKSAERVAYKEEYNKARIKAARRQAKRDAYNKPKWHNKLLGGRRFNEPRHETSNMEKMVYGGHSEHSSKKSNMERLMGL